MSTESHGKPISAALFNKNRRAVLALLFGHPDQEFYLRQIVRACGGGVGAVQRELKQLADAGIIRRAARHKQVYFRANAACPVFEELKSLVLKTAGVADVLRVALAPLGDRIVVAFIFGSVARAQQKRESDVDCVVVGQVTFSEVVESLADAQQHLAREVNPVVYSPEEFRSKLATGHHFLTRVLKKPKVFLIGDEDELARLAAKRVARGT
jgi:predicted nucleotidyltransferase